MPFTLSQQQSLLAQKGIGTTILKRLQEMGLETDPAFILERGAELTGSTCWRNSPQARKAIETAVNWAKTQCDVTTEK
ncbi:TPA: recombinase RecA [Pasteurella multocida]